MSLRTRDSLAVIHQRTLELIVRGASLQEVLDALCDGIDALDPDPCHGIPSRTRRRESRRPP
jgi:hypothetical protein